MGVPIRIVVRWVIATLLVTIPVAYLHWHWHYEDGKTLRMLSFRSFHEQTLSQQKPEMWSLMLYMVIAVACLNLASLVVAWILGMIFPNRQG